MTEQATIKFLTTSAAYLGLEVTEKD